MKDANRFYRTFRSIFKPFFLIFFPFKVHGAENVPTDRPVVLCANHSNAADPFLIAMSLPKDLPLRFMAKKELMETPLLGAFLARLGVFGVDRGHSDLAAVKTAIRTLRDGSNLLVFPEGTRVKYEGEAEPKSGVVMIAVHTGAPLLPVYAGKRRKLFRKTHIIFGEPFLPETEMRRGSAEEYRAYAEEVMRRCYALGREAEGK